MAIDLTGSTFGHLSVIERVEGRPMGKHYGCVSASAASDW